MTLISVRRTSIRETQFEVDVSDPSEVEFRALVAAYSYDFGNAREVESSYEVVPSPPSTELLAAAQKVGEAALDNLVHNEFDEDACRVSSASVYDQITFLLSRGWSEQQLLEVLERQPHFRRPPQIPEAGIESAMLATDQ